MDEPPQPEPPSSHSGPASPPDRETGPEHYPVEAT